MSFTLISRRGLLRAGLAASLAASVAACGKRGPLEPPPDSAKDATKQASQSGQQEGLPGVGVKGSKKRPPSIQPPKRDLFLDFLL